MKVVIVLSLALLTVTSISSQVVPGWLSYYNYRLRGRYIPTPPVPHLRRSYTSFRIPYRRPGTTGYLVPQEDHIFGIPRENMTCLIRDYECHKIGQCGVMDRLYVYDLTCPYPNTECCNG